MPTRLSISLLLQVVTSFIVLTLVAGLVIAAGNAFDRLETADRVLATANVSRDLFTAMQAIRVERGLASGALDMEKPVDANMRDLVTSTRAQFETALDGATAKLVNGKFSETGTALEEIRDNRARFSDLLRHAEEAFAFPRNQRPAGLGAKVIAADNKFVDALDGLSERLSSEIVQIDPFIAEMMKMKQLGWVVRDGGGTERLVMGMWIARGEDYSGSTRQRVAELTGRMDGAWKIIQDDVGLKVVPAALRDAVENATRVYFDELRSKRKAIIDALTAGTPLGEAGSEWINLSNHALEPLAAIPSTAFDLTAAHANEQAQIARRYFLFSIALALLAVTFGICAIALVTRHVARPMAKITAAVRAVAAGDLHGAIPFEQRNDEVGDLARALEVLRDNAVAKQRMEAELIRKERLSAVGQLTATVAHELRNPLSSIRNCAYTLREMVGGSAGLERPVARIERSITRCDRIIADLLDFTRMRELQLSSIALDDWLAELLAEQKLPDGIALVRNFAAPGRQLDFDGDRMRQVIVNLIENAAQAMDSQAEADPSSRERRITVSTRASGEFFDIAIEDTGPGMSAEVLAKVFEPLFSTKAFGTGLGLPTVKQIVEQHGGTVTISSEEAKGTSVRIRLPLAVPAAIAA